MELDFDKYCVLDTSPIDILLRASHRRLKVSNRKSSGKLKYGDDILNLKEGFYQNRLYHDNSSLNSDVSCNVLRHRDNELLKRDSVYQSSKKAEHIEGRQKIELSQESASTLSLWIIDSLCKSAEDADKQNRSSALSFSKSESQIELCFPEPSTYSFPPDSEQVQNDLSKGLDCREAVSFGRVDGPVNYSIRHKSLSVKSALSHSPARTSKDSLNANCPKARYAPVRMMSNLFNKSMLGSSSSLNDARNRHVDIDGKYSSFDSGKPNHEGCISHIASKENNDSVLRLSPAYLHGLLKLEFKQGMPFFKFLLKSPNDIYVAEIKKSENALTWAYIFHSLHGKGKKNKTSGLGIKEGGLNSSIVGQIRVSCYIHTEIQATGTLKEYMVTEFVLSDMSCSRIVSDEIFSSGACKPNELLPKKKTKGPHDNSLAHCARPEIEIASVVMQVPFKKRESLKLKSDDKVIENIFPKLVGLPCLEHEKQLNCNRLNLGKMHVVIPSGSHSLPHNDSQGPSPLLDRWRLGGGCDCGGWDMSCPINIFSNENIQITEGFVDNKQPLELFFQGRKVKSPAFSMSTIEDGKYAVDFHSQLSSLQAFAICVATLHMESASGHQPIKQQRCDSLKVFPEEEIKNVMGAIIEDENTVEESLQSFVINPPFSPIGRV